MKYSMLTAFFLLMTISLSAQEDNWMTYPAKNKDTAKVKGTVTYEEDARTQKLIDFMAAPLPPEYKVMIDGYRVQIYFSNDRELINKQRENFQRAFPDVETYVLYDAPNYSIKVGNFRTEIQAEELRNSISEDFPSSIIQKSKIELPKIKEPQIVLNEEEK